MRYLKISLFVLLCLPASEITAVDNLKKVPFAYKPFMQATYAVCHCEDPPPYEERPYVLYQFLLDKTHELPFRFQRYRRSRIDMRPQVAQIEFSPNGLTNVSPGGQLPVKTAAFRRPVPEEAYRHPFLSSDVRMNEAGAMLGTRALESELFLFPVFRTDGMTLQEGHRWQYSAPPFVMLEGTLELLRENKLRPKELPPTTIHSHWKDWKEVEGRRFRVIDVWFEVKADEKLQQGKGDGKVRYEGTSYFSPELGLPVVTVLKGDGFVVDKRGNKKTIFLRRKEVLIHFEPYSEEKARQKHETEAARREADKARSRQQELPPDSRPHEMEETEVDDSKASETEAKPEKGK